MFFNKKGQGTIEYLVIIAIVVVLSLVVVGLVLTQVDNSSQVSSSSNQLGLSSQVIGVTESLVSFSDGNLVVRLLNNSGDFITVSNVKVGDFNASFSEDMAQGGSRLFSVSSGVPCTQGSVVSKSLVVTYVTRDGLSKTVTYPSQVMFDCTPYTINQANLANQCPSCPTCEVCADPVELHSGQIICYDADNNPDSCPPSTGPENQDANWDGTAKSYTDNGCGVGTVLDNHTGLCWQKDGSSVTMDWVTAFTTCASATTGGKSDWRVPSNVELITFADYNCSGTKAAPSSSNCLQRYVNIAFEATNLNDGSTGSVYGYWSSTTVPSNTGRAYYLYSYSGYIGFGYKTDASNFGARCVRSGS